MLSALTFSVIVSAATPLSPANQAVMATKLAQAVANTRGYTETKVYVGAMPPGFSITAPLPQLTLIGSLVSTPVAENAGPAAEIYYQLPPGTSDNTLQTYRHKLEAGGWKASTFMQRFEQAENPSGGFAVSRPKPENPDLYCSARGFLAFMRLRSMPDVVAVSFGSGQQFTSLCKMSAVLSAMPTPPPPPPLPVLQAPPDVTMEAGERFAAHVSAASSSESDAALTSAVPLPRIGADFAQQLTSAGWAPNDPAQSATAYAQAFHMTSKGRRLYAILALLSTGKEQKYDATLRIVDLDAKPSSGTGFSFPFFP